MPKVKDCKKSMFVKRAKAHAARAMELAETASTSPLAKAWAEAAKHAASEATLAAEGSTGAKTKIGAYMAERFAGAAMLAAEYAASQSHKEAAGISIGQPPEQISRRPQSQWDSFYL